MTRKAQNRPGTPGIHTSRTVIAFLLLALLPGCSLRPTPWEMQRAGTQTELPDHVIVISIDGLRPDAIESAGAETLRQMMRTGAYSLQARTILPSKTLPSHTSMVTGVGPDQHGITWNDDRIAQYGRVRVPTMFELAHAQGLQTAAFFGKAKLGHLIRPGTLDRASVPRGYEIRLAPRIAQDVVQYLKFREPELLFVHIPDPDLAGHAAGWMTAPYRLAVRRADAAVGHIWAAAVQAFGDDVVILVTADHGGHGRGHGEADTPTDRTIPWIAWGRGVADGRIAAEIDTYDTAATALWLLGVPRPDGWDGEPVRGAFESWLLARRDPRATPAAF